MLNTTLPQEATVRNNCIHNLLKPIIILTITSTTETNEELIFSTNSLVKAGGNTLHFSTLVGGRNLGEVKKGVFGS